MKRVLCFLLILGLVFSVCAIAETKDTDTAPAAPVPEEANEAEAMPMEDSAPS